MPIGDSRVARNPVKDRLATQTARLALELLGPTAQAVSFPGLFVEQHMRELAGFQQVWFYEVDETTLRKSRATHPDLYINPTNLYLNPPELTGPTYHDLDGCQTATTMLRLGAGKYLHQQGQRRVNHFVNIVVPSRQGNIPGMTVAKQEMQLNNLIRDAFPHHRTEKLESIRYGNLTAGHTIMWIHQWHCLA